jgi:hypothetical protein
VDVRAHEKLLRMTTLVIAYLSSVLNVEWKALREAVLWKGCYQTGKRGGHLAAPLYRVRLTLGRRSHVAPPSCRPQRLSPG